VSALCLAAGLLLAPLGEAVTLRWTHSVQRSVWEEDYRLEAGALRLTSARVQGTGAGMEPPPDSVLRDGAWHYTPALPLLPEVQLRHSPHVQPYIICVAGQCRPVTAWLPGLPAEAVLTLRPCQDDEAERGPAKPATMPP
jgi:hypothetical protein